MILKYGLKIIINNYMKTFKEYLTERVYIDQLERIEHSINQKAGHFNIRFRLAGNHFFDRINTDRNKIEITPNYIEKIFEKLLVRYGKLLITMREGSEFILKDASSNVVVPIVVKPNNIFAAKTIMQKANFYTRDKTLRV